MARNKKVEILSHDGQVLHPITDGDCVIFPDGETLARKLSEQEAVMYTPEVVNSSPMFKVGEGDSSDYSANVLDGAYQEAVLKGQTYVNTIQEPSADVITLPTPFTEYERTQNKTFTEMQDGTFGLNLVGQSYVNCIQEPSEPSYVALGENLEFQNKKVEYTTDGQIKSAMLNGMTLVNVVDRIWFHNTGKHFFYINLKQYEVNKDYLLVMFNAPNEITQIYLGNSSTTMMWRNYTTDFIRNGSTVSLKVTCPSNYDGSTTVPHFKFGSSEPSLDEVKQMKAMLIPYQEGMENWDIPYFEGMQSVTMTTELENVCSRYNSSVAKNGKTFTVGTWENRGLKLSTTDNIAKYNFKPNTKYLVQFKVTNLNLDGLSSISIAFSDDKISTGNSLFGDNAVVEVKSNGIYRGILTTSNVISTSNFVIKGISNQWENSTSTTRKLTISQIMCIEYQNGMENWDLPYFETTQLMKPLKVQSVSKNLFDTANMFNSYKTTVSEVTTNSFRLTGTDSNATYKNTPFIFNVKPNTDYKITFKSETTDADALCDVYDANNKYLGNRNFNSGNNTRVSVRFYVNMNNTKNGTVKYYDIQMEESLTETPYVPHQEKTISALEPITLRAIGNVKDTLDLSTGEYIQRIGEIVLDGSQSWYTPTEMENVIWAECAIEPNKFKKGSPDTAQLCDKFIFEHNNEDREHIRLNAGEPYASRIRIFINKTKLSAYTSDAINEYIKSIGGLKFQAELANPITRKISLEYPNLQTYQDITHVQSIAMDGTLIPNIYLPSDIAYKALLKPNTKYNVIVDREVISSDNQLTVNLGGTTANITANRTLITTPSTLSNETLTFSSKGNRIGKAMLIENSTLLNGDIPYFEGIGDVHLGRVVENLCMANHTTVGGATSTGTLYSDKITSKITKTGSHVHIFQLTKNLENSKRYFIYCPYDYQYIIYGFRHEYNNSLSYTYQSCEGINKKYAIIKIDGNQQKNPYTHLAVGCHGNIPVDTTMTIRRPIICEYVDGMENWDWESIGYFTGARNIGNEFMRISNKNLFDLNKDDFVQGSRLIANNLQVSSSSIRITSKNLKTFKCKPNTSYTVTLNNSNYDLGIYVIDNDGNVLYDSGWFSQKSNKTFTTNEKAKYFVFHCRKTDNSTITLDDYNYSSIQLEEATSATSYVAHKHNSLHILPNEQIPLTFVQGGIYYTEGDTWANAINNTTTDRIRTQLLDLEPNETYRVSCGHSNHGFGCQGYNNSLLGKTDSGWKFDDYYFTTTKDVHKYAIVVRYKDNSNITPSVLHQIRLEKVTDVTLRSVSSVRDELDLTRGVYTQRIGEVILDGSEDENWGIPSTGSDTANTIIFRTPVVVPKPTSSNYVANIVCNSFKAVKADDTWNNDIEGISVNQLSRIDIRIKKNKLNQENKDGFKVYLQQNPITVQYELKTPIEHKINIPMKNELNQTIAKPNGVFTLPLMYSETNHVDINSQIYPKVQSRDYISYPVIANNSQLHTVFHNKLGTGNLTVNLCGTNVTSVDGTSKCTVTTPSTISQYELRLSGARNKVSNVCVFSGDYMNVDVPYVQGMMNAVNPIVKNIGKNLFSSKLTLGLWDRYNKCVVNNNNYFCSNDLIRVTPSTTLKISGTAFDTNAGGNVMFYDKNKNYLGTNKEVWVLNNAKIPSDAYYIAFHFSVNPYLYDINGTLQIEESSTPSQYEPYKENICYVDCGEIRLTPDMFEQGNFGSDASKTYEENKATATNRYRVKTLVKVEPNTTYNIRYTEHDSAVFEYGKDEKKLTLGYNINKSTLTITTSNNCYYLAFNFVTSMLPTQYVSIIKVSEIITLRSLPNGVRDELNLQTGEYIQRIGEVVLDGNQTFTHLKTKNGIAFYYRYLDDMNASNHNWYPNRCFICNNKNVVSIGETYPSDTWYDDRITPIGSYFQSNKNGVGIFTSADNIKNYLQSNPITVQYELKTPIVKQIDVNSFPHSYKDGHVVIESNDPSTNVTAQLTYQCVTNRSGQIQEHTEQVEKQERQINELETLILENIRQNQNRSQNFLTSLISTLEIEEE